MKTSFINTIDKTVIFCIISFALQIEAYFKPHLYHSSELNLVQKNNSFKQLEPFKTKKITIAVIDTGVDVHHQFLKKSLWKNLGESGVDKSGQDICCNLIDDDHNGYVDDVHGWNFINKNSDLSDKNGHGTHISGIIIEQFNSHIVNDKFNQKTSDNFKEDDENLIEIMVLKYYDEKKSVQENLKAYHQALKYAIGQDVDIINVSGGGYEIDFVEKKILQLAEKKNIWVVAAAGNDQIRLNQKLYYPASYNMKNIISVGALDSNKDKIFTQMSLASFSNYGELVTCFAPGKNIYSTLPGNKWGEMSGTSQATAFVTGVLAKKMIISEFSLRPNTYKASSLTQLKLKLNLKSFKAHDVTQFALVDEI